MDRIERAQEFLDEASDALVAISSALWAVSLLKLDLPTSAYEILDELTETIENLHEPLLSLISAIDDLANREVVE